MRLVLIFFVLPLSVCSGRTEYIEVPREIPEELLQPAAGWTGGAPQTDREWVRATVAERTGRLQANAQLRAIAELQAGLGPQ